MNDSRNNISPLDDAHDEIVRVKQNAFFDAAERRGYTRSILADMTGISRDTLRTYKSTPSFKSSIMSLTMTRRLVKKVPPELGSILLDETGVHLVPDNPTETDWLSFGEKCATFAGKVMRYQASDGFIDHREDADLRQDVITIVAEGEGAVRG